MCRRFPACLRLWQRLFLRTQWFRSSDRSGSPCTDSELLQKSAARHWPLASVQKTATAADGTKIVKGVYATEAIEPTTFVSQYYVHKKFERNSKEHKSYEKREAPSSNYCTVSGQGKYFHDAWESENNKGMYINHFRIHPNLDLVLKKIKSAPNLLQADNELLLFRAKRHIEAGEQLVWDYTSGEKMADHNNANAGCFPWPGNSCLFRPLHWEVLEVLPPGKTR